MEGQFASYLARAACTAAVLLVGRQVFLVAQDVVRAVRVYLELPGPKQDLILGNVRQVCVKHMCADHASMQLTWQEGGAPSAPQVSAPCCMAATASCSACTYGWAPGNSRPQQCAAYSSDVPWLHPHHTASVISMQPASGPLSQPAGTQCQQQQAT
jgi:hypothetical protein